MGITASDIKFVKSQVFDDVPEGGGAPTGDVINDGTSNGIFNDISELDRAGGRVNLRKMFVQVQTPDVDGYFGANVIVADQYDDPRVCVSLFQTDDFFDVRTDAANRIESYLAKGPTYSGYLFGDHIAGQGTVTLIQRSEVPLPVSGHTLVLRKNEGLSTQYDEFIRITNVSSSVRTFTDDKGDFQRTQVVLTISNPLSQDFNGFDASRYDTSINYTNKTKVCESIVANAARYYGAVKLDQDVAIGDFTAKGESIYTQLVPSTKIEVPIADSRFNQQLLAAVDSGSSVTTTLNSIFSSTQALYIGGSILPGSLTLTRSGITLNDKGGVLQNAGTNVGTVDYGNGVLRLSTDLFGTGSGAHSVTYKPSVLTTLVNDSLGLDVTQESQRLSWVYTLDPVPTRGTLQVSYRALGSWYTLSDDGSGALKGSDSSFGAGTINFSTGTVSLTLGAMPDVGSRIISVWATPAAAKPLTTLTPSTFGDVLALEAFVSVGHGIDPGTVSLSWNAGTARSATDSAGNLTGDATGLVSYGQGTIRFRPNTLPAKGTNITLTISEVTQQNGGISAFTDGGSTWNFTLTAPVKARSVDLGIVGQFPVREFPGVDKTSKFSIHVFDNGSGVLQVANQTGNLNVGTVNYSTGACTITKSVGGYLNEQPKFENRTPLGGSGDPSSYIKQTGYETRTLTLTFLNGPGTDTIPIPEWSWWTGAQSHAAEYRYGGTNGATAQNYSFALNSLVLNVGLVYSAPGYLGSSNPNVLREFNLGTTNRYVVSGNTLQLNPSPTTGVGTAAGNFFSEIATVTSWPAGVSPIPNYVNGSSVPPVSGTSSPQLVDTISARTAVSPLVNGGFNVAGSWSDGTTFTATANSSGVISTGSAPTGTTTTTPGSYGVFGVVDYEMGLVELRFGRRVGADWVGQPGVIDVSTLGLSGITYIQSRGVQADTLRYNATGYSYIPLDPDVLGLNTVRLPADGRVPIFREGSFAVLGNTGTITGTVTNGQTVDCGRVRLSRVRVIGNNGALITSGYTVDLDLGTVTFTNVSGYSQPVTVEHRIEDMMLVSGVQINGQLSFTRAVTHNYPAGSQSFISSALVAGDIHARATVLFDQATWNNVWSDAINGSAATGTFNDAQYPIAVTNKGAIKERWAIVFTNSTSFQVIGEHVGVIATGNTSTDCAPTNPEASVPYFSIPKEGWGLGWGPGNVVRFNTEAAMIPVWCVRTILQGPETVADDSFTLLSRGDVDRP